MSIDKTHTQFTLAQQGWIDKKIAHAVGIVKDAKRKSFTPEQLDAAIAQFRADVNLEFAKMGKANTDGR